MSNTAHIAMPGDGPAAPTNGAAGVVNAAWHKDLVGERVALPSGGWVQMRHASDLRARHRKEVAGAITDEMTPVDVLNMQQAVARVMIVDWELPYLPGEVIPALNSGNPLDDLTALDENALIKHLEPVLAVFNPREVDPADHANPDSPTPPAAA